MLTGGALRSRAARAAEATSYPAALGNMVGQAAKSSTISGQLVEMLGPSMACVDGFKRWQKAVMIGQLTLLFACLPRSTSCEHVDRLQALFACAYPVPGHASCQPPVDCMIHQPLGLAGASTSVSGSYDYVVVLNTKTTDYVVVDRGPVHYHIFSFTVGGQSPSWRHVAQQQGD